MNFHNSDGRVFEDPEAEFSHGKDTQVGDFAWFEEDILLVTKVDGDRADTIDHPAAAEMMAAVLGPNHPTSFKDSLALATRIHWRYLGKGWAAARRFVQRADLNTTGSSGRAGIVAEESDWKALCEATAMSVNEDAS